MLQSGRGGAPRRIGNDKEEWVCTFGTWHKVGVSATPPPPASAVGVSKRFVASGGATDHPTDRVGTDRRGPKVANQTVVQQSDAARVPPEPPQRIGGGYNLSPSVHLPSPRKRADVEVVDRGPRDFCGAAPINMPGARNSGGKTSAGPPNGAGVMKTGGRKRAGRAASSASSRDGGAATTSGKQGASSSTGAGDAGNNSRLSSAGSVASDAASERESEALRPEGGGGAAEGDSMVLDPSVEKSAKRQKLNESSTHDEASAAGPARLNMSVDSEAAAAAAPVPGAGPADGRRDSVGTLPPDHVGGGAVDPHSSGAANPRSPDDASFTFDGCPGGPSAGAAANAAVVHQLPSAAPSAGFVGSSGTLTASQQLGGPSAMGAGGPAPSSPQQTMEIDEEDNVVVPPRPVSHGAALGSSGTLMLPGDVGVVSNSSASVGPDMGSSSSSSASGAVGSASTSASTAAAASRKAGSGAPPPLPSSSAASPLNYSSSTTEKLGQSDSGRKLRPHRSAPNLATTSAATQSESAPPKSSSSGGSSMRDIVAAAAAGGQAGAAGVAQRRIFGEQGGLGSSKATAANGGGGVPAGSGRMATTPEWAKDGMGGPAAVPGPRPSSGGAGQRAGYFPRASGVGLSSANLMRYKFGGS